MPRESDRPFRCAAAAGAILFILGSLAAFQSDAGAGLPTAQKRIGFQYEFLQITPTQTVELERFSSAKKVLSGEPSYLLARIGEQVSGRGAFNAHIRVVPRIIEERGIELDILINIDNEKAIHQKVTVGNYESAVIEFLRSLTDAARYALKVTPVIEAEPLLRDFGDGPYRLDMRGQFLVVNRKEVLATTAPTVTATVADAVLAFGQSGRGVFVLAFAAFPGAAPIGVSSGNMISFRDGKDLYEWTFAGPVLPAGRWRVWVRHNPVFDLAAAHLQSPFASAFSAKDAWKNFFSKNIP